MDPNSQRVVILTGVTDDLYRSRRTDDPILCTSTGKRVQLYQAINEATGSPPLLLSCHPRGYAKPVPLPAMETTFAGCRQLFSPASSIRKLRFVLDIFRYAIHVHRNTTAKDILIFDNFDLPYVIAIHYCRLRGRRNRVVVEYEDGRHEIDKGWAACLSASAEALGKPLVNAAIVATPPLANRLPANVPWICIPGLILPNVAFRPSPEGDEPIRFLFSGSLDVERGSQLLIEYLEAGAFPERSVFHITGHGIFSGEFQRLAERYPECIRFHGRVSFKDLEAIRAMCHFGLNLQSSANPISAVTYPSKTFDYINAGLRVISTRAAGVEEVLGGLAIYIEDEAVSGLAAGIGIACNHFRSHERFEPIPSNHPHTVGGTVVRLRALLRKCGMKLVDDASSSPSIDSGGQVPEPIS